MLKPALAILGVILPLAAGVAREPATPDSTSAGGPRDVRVCVYEFEPLVSLAPTGAPEGLYIDLLERVAKDEGWRLGYAPGAWDECLRALTEGRVDLVPVVGISDDRMRRFAFSSEIPVLDWGVVFRRPDTEIESIFDLRGKRIGVLKGSIYTDGFRSLIAQFGIGASLVEWDDYRALFRALERGELDAGINAQISGAAIAPEYGLEPTRIYFSPVRLAFAAPKDRAELLRVLDRDLARLKATPGSTWHESFARWLPAPGTTKVPRWLIPLLAFAALLVLVSVTFTWTLRRRVAARTADLQAANAQLRRSEALLRSFSDAVPEPIFLKDCEGRYVFLNAASAEVLGRAAGEMVGRTDLELHGDPVVAAQIMATDRRIMETGVAEAVEEVILTAKGPRLYLSTKTPYRDGQRHTVGIVGAARDITEQRATEEQLRQAQKLESIGRLAGGVAHDFNNLLTVILSCAASLEESAVAGGLPFLEEIREICGAGRRAATLTGQLLAFARKQVITPTALDLNTVIGGTKNLLRRVLGENVELITRLGSDLWPVHCDPGQVEQVIMNLVMNARDAMPAGGSITIETSNVPRDRADVLGHPGEWVRMSIRDTGSGITPEVLAHLFEPFFTTKDKGRGTGLGLATVYGIVRQSHGHIQVESKMGEGSHFAVLLPRWDGAVAAFPAPQPAQPGGGHGAVLVVEDDPDVRQVTIRSLRSGGYDVTAVGSAAEALALDPALLRRVRLLVSDIVMPGMDGRSLAAALRLKHPQLAVLFVSGYSEDSIGLHDALEPSVDLLQKPFTASELLARARSVLDVVATRVIGGGVRAHPAEHRLPRPP